MINGSAAVVALAVTAALFTIVNHPGNTRKKKDAAMPRKSRDFRREATRVPYELELDDGNVVTFQDPNRLTTRSAFELTREEDPEKVLGILLGKDFDGFWREWGEYPVDQTNALIEDVMSYYGADQGKRAK